MHATRITSRGVVSSIQYIDRWGDVDYIEDNVDLCDRAGCRCDGPRVVCDDDDRHNVFFVQAIHDAYARQCARNCECQPLPEELQTPSSIRIGGIDFTGAPKGTS